MLALVCAALPLLLGCLTADARRALLLLQEAMVKKSAAAAGLCEW